MRAVRPESLRPSDIIRLYGIIKDGKSRKGFGRRVVVAERHVESDSVRVVWRGITKDSVGHHVSTVAEGITFIPRRPLAPIEGIWEGELIPGARGRVVEYNNRRYYPPEGGIMPAASRTKGKAGAAKRGRPAGSTNKAKANGGDTRERASEAQLDKLSTQVVKMRDVQSKGWTEICETLDIQPSRARQLYNRGGGEPTRQKATSGRASGGRTAAAAKGKSTRGRKGKNPS
jgi:hypothetical protein